MCWLVYIQDEYSELEAAVAKSVLYYRVIEFRKQCTVRHKTRQKSRSLVILPEVPNIKYKYISAIKLTKKKLLIHLYII